MSLLLYDKPAQSSAYWTNLDYHAQAWKRTKRANRGYHIGSFQIQNAEMTQLTDFYNTWMGNRVVESTYGITSWEGIIWQLDLVKNGINYRRTLNPEFWHNRIKVFYTTGAGAQAFIDWSENTDSSGIYGEMEKIITLGTESAAGATGHQSTALTEYAWPRSRNVGGISIGEVKPNSGSDGLYITTAGFWSTLNWQYYESTQSEQDADVAITALVGASEFVTAGRIEANTMDVTSEGQSTPQRVGDLIEAIVKDGDSSGNIWRGGVYADKKFVYEQVPTTVDYIYRDGMLYNKAGTPVIPELLDPGFYLRDTNAPTGSQPPGSSNLWDDPQVSYCDEVELEAGVALRLGFPGQDERIEILLSQTHPLKGVSEPVHTGPPNVLF